MFFGSHRNASSSSETHSPSLSPHHGADEIKGEDKTSLPSVAEVTCPTRNLVKYILNEAAFHFYTETGSTIGAHRRGRRLFRSLEERGVGGGAQQLNHPMPFGRTHVESFLSMSLRACRRRERGKFIGGGLLGHKRSREGRQEDGHGVLGPSSGEYNIGDEAKGNINERSVDRGVGGDQQKTVREKLLAVFEEEVLQINSSSQDKCEESRTQQLPDEQVEERDWKREEEERGENDGYFSLCCRDEDDRRICLAIRRMLEERDEERGEEEAEGDEGCRESKSLARVNTRYDARYDVGNRTGNNTYTTAAQQALPVPSSSPSSSLFVPDEISSVCCSWTPLFAACVFLSPTIITYLLLLGADPNIRCCVGLKGNYCCFSTGTTDDEGRNEHLCEKKYALEALLLREDLLMPQSTIQSGSSRSSYLKGEVEETWCLLIDFFVDICGFRGFFDPKPRLLSDDLERFGYLGLLGRCYLKGLRPTVDTLLTLLTAERGEHELEEKMALSRGRWAERAEEILRRAVDKKSIQTVITAHEKEEARHRRWSRSSGQEKEEEEEGEGTSTRITTGAKRRRSGIGVSSEDEEEDWEEGAEEEEEEWSKHDGEEAIGSSREEGVEVDFDDERCGERSIGGLVDAVKGIVVAMRREGRHCGETSEGEKKRIISGCRNDDAFKGMTSATSSCTTFISAISEDLHDMLFTKLIVTHSATFLRVFLGIPILSSSSVHDEAPHVAHHVDSYAMMPQYGVRGLEAFITQSANTFSEGHIFSMIDAVVVPLSPLSQPSEEEKELENRTGRIQHSDELHLPRAHSPSFLGGVVPSESCLRLAFRHWAPAFVLRLLWRAGYIEPAQQETMENGRPTVFCDLLNCTAFSRRWEETREHEDCFPSVKNPMSTLWSLIDSHRCRWRLSKTQEEDNYRRYLYNHSGEASDATAYGDGSSLPFSRRFSLKLLLRDLVENKAFTSSTGHSLSIILDEIVAARLRKRTRNKSNCRYSLSLDAFHSPVEATHSTAVGANDGGQRLQLEAEEIDFDEEEEAKLFARREKRRLKRFSQAVSLCRDTYNLLNVLISLAGRGKDTLSIPSINASFINKTMTLRSQRGHSVAGNSSFTEKRIGSVGDSSVLHLGVYITRYASETVAPFFLECLVREGVYLGTEEKLAEALVSRLLHRSTATAECTAALIDVLVAAGAAEAGTLLLSFTQQNARGREHLFNEVEQKLIGEIGPDVYSSAYPTTLEGEDASANKNAKRGERGARRDEGVAYFQASSTDEDEA